MDYPLRRILRSTPAVTAFFVGPLLAILISTALAQAPKQKEGEPREKPLWQRLLQGDDAKHAAELEKAIAGAWRLTDGLKQSRRPRSCATFGWRFRGRSITTW